MTKTTVASCFAEILKNVMRGFYIDLHRTIPLSKTIRVFLPQLTQNVTALKMGLKVSVKELNVKLNLKNVVNTV